MIRTLPLALLLFVSPAMAHDWYDADCCHNRDCHALADGAVTATSKGWLIRETGELIPFGDARERRSQDSHFHRCEPKAGRTRCLYVPPFGT